MAGPFLSICVPSYNRPEQLIRLLKSIDAKDSAEIEVVICEDKSPARAAIQKQVDAFRENSLLPCHLFLNETNLGYDENLKELIKRASGKYMMYMGDDDIFQPGRLDEYIGFLKTYPDPAYILRRYAVVHRDNGSEDFRYFSEHTFFQPGEEAFATLFRKSVFISGFCFRRDFVLPWYNTERFKGTLLYQLFLCAKLVLHYPSAYCDIPITLMDESARGIPEFGSSENEKEKYTPGRISVDNSINFMKSFLVVTGYFDEHEGISATNIFLTDLSKYAYPVLSIQRPNGIRKFLEYDKRLRKEIGMNRTYHYYLYYYALLFLGKENCDKLIRGIKKILGKTPKL